MTAQEPPLPQGSLVAFRGEPLGSNETQESIGRALLEGTFPWATSGAIDQATQIMATRVRSDLERDDFDPLPSELISEILEIIGRPRV
jgi:hypothetical protein